MYLQYIAVGLYICLFALIITLYFMFIDFVDFVNIKLRHIDRLFYYSCGRILKDVKEFEEIEKSTGKK